MSVPAVPVRCPRAGIVALLKQDMVLLLVLVAMMMEVHVSSMVPRGVPRDVGTAKPLEDQGVELVGEFAPYFDDLSGAAVVAERPGHLLIGHRLTVAFALPPALCQLLFVFGDEVESAAAPVSPLDGIHHVGVMQGFM